MGIIYISDDILLLSTYQYEESYIYSLTDIYNYILLILYQWDE